MSECISRHGEYGSHDPGAGPERFHCKRCFAFDEDAALARIAELEARLRRHEVTVKVDDKAIMGAVKQHLADFKDQLEAAKGGPVRILTEADAKVGEFVLAWHPLDDGDPVEIPLNEPWVLPGTDVRVGEFRLSTREVPAADEPMLCDGCDSTDKPVQATDDGRALACPDCLPSANATIAEATREVPEVSGG